MTIPEEIEQLKMQFGKATDEKQQAQILVEILEKYSSINDTHAQNYIDQLLRLSDSIGESVYKAWGYFFLANLKRLQVKYEDSLNLRQQCHVCF